MGAKKQFFTSHNTVKTSQFTNGSIYIKEDDQDWGSAGMNDIQKEPDSNQ